MTEQLPLPGDQRPRAPSPNGAGRRAPADGGLLAVQQSILTAFAATGRPPAMEAMEEAARPFDVPARQVLDDLAAADYIGLDGNRHICAAYPFSAVPTVHRVRLPTGVEAYAMCAIDALGIPPMLDCDAAIFSADPLTGASVTVSFSGDVVLWDPAEAAVFVGRRSCNGPAAAVCCGYLNFFESREAAEKWAAGHPEVAGGVVSQADAITLGRDIFGELLADIT